jgi:glycosyltransferase involved in cell wall biosynthesis
MNIAVILPSLDNKGPNLIAKYLVDKLVKDNSVHVYYFDDVVNLEFSCPTTRISFFSKIHFQSYDIIHSHMLRPDLYVAYWSLFYKFRFSKITTVHQETFRALTIQYNLFIAFMATFLWNIAYLFFNRIIVLNPTISKQIWFVNKKRVHIIGNGIPDLGAVFYDGISEKDQDLLVSFKSKFDFILGSCCLLIERKGLDQVILALKHLPNVGYILIGDGPQRDMLYNLARFHNVSHQCLFLGSRSDGFKFYSYFNAYVLPSLSEGYPIAAIEAARVGLPIVCSNINVLKDIFSESEVAFFELGDVSSLVETLLYLMNNIGSFSDNLLLKYKMEMSDKVMFNNYINIYNEFIQK